MALADDPGILIWSFKGASFARVVDGDSWPMWFQVDTIMSVEPLLDSTQLYADIGGRTYADLSLRAAFDTGTQRDSACNLVGQRGTLSNGNGRSRTAVLRSAQPTGVNNGFFMADLTFTAA
jgi:hypothetical protein